jgi:ketosteroid isomerase-like protein
MGTISSGKSILLIRVWSKFGEHQKQIHMKKLFYLIFALSALNANAQGMQDCEDLAKAEKQVAANINMYKETWDKIFNQRDIDQVNEKNFDTHVTWLTQKEKIGGEGIESFKKHFNYYLTTFSDIKFTFIDLWGHGDKLVKHWNFQGKHTQTGKSMNLSGVTLVKMKDGKIIEEQDFDDNLSYNQQLGQFLVK